MSETILVPHCRLPANVRMAFTTRDGGVSPPPWDSLNLGLHVGDRQDRVTANRRRVREWLELPAEPVWLNQVHGTGVVAAEKAVPGTEADAGFTRTPGVVCVVMTADCLPVLFADRAGTVVAASHAGWRGLAAGVLGETVAAMACRAGDLIACLGPAIGPRHFEVGPEVRSAFIARAEDAEHRLEIEACFASSARSGHFRADLYGLAGVELQRLGVGQVCGVDYCTYGDRARFFSHRRDGVTGRMASLAWLVAQ